MTLALTWVLFERRASTGLVFIAMNAFIHTVMYAYYAAVLFPKGRALLVPHTLPRTHSHTHMAAAAAM